MEGHRSKKLPYIIFVKGFSTKQTSLGTGFLLMEKYMDKIILSTSKEGTFSFRNRYMQKSRFNKYIKGIFTNSIGEYCMII